MNWVSWSQLPQGAIITTKQPRQASLMNRDNLYIGLWLIWTVVLACLIAYVLIQ